MAETAGTPRKGQIVRIRNRKTRKGPRTEYMRLLVDASESTANMDLGLVLYGYRTRADGSPTHVRPVARSLDADQVEIVLTPADEARRALHGGTSRDALSPAVRAEYDRLLALVMASMTDDSAADPGPEAVIGGTGRCNPRYRGTTMSDDLIAFLNARLADDMAIAARTQDLRDKLNDPHRQIDPNVRNGAEYAWCETAAGPARRRREVEAKRAMLAELTRWPFDYRPGCNDPIRLFVHLLASVYSDHPDYDPAWRPAP